MRVTCLSNRVRTVSPIALVLMLAMLAHGCGRGTSNETTSTEPAPAAAAPPAPATPPPPPEEALEPELDAAPEARVTASSAQADLGPGGVLMARNPGWHSTLEPKYPQWIQVRFASPQMISAVELLHQYQHAERAPGRFDIQTSADGKSWTTVAAVENGCTGDRGRWRAFELPQQVTTRQLRLLIHGNCGDPQLVTLRGLRVR